MEQFVSSLFDMSELISIRKEQNLSGFVKDTISFMASGVFDKEVCGKGDRQCLSGLQQVSLVLSLLLFCIVVFVWALRQTGNGRRLWSVRNRNSCTYNNHPLLFYYSIQHILSINIFYKIKTGFCT